MVPWVGAKTRKNPRKLLGSSFRFHQETMASSFVTTVELPGAYLTVSQLTHGLKTFFGEISFSQLFWRRQWRQQLWIDHLVVCGGSRRTCALVYEQNGPLGSRFYMRTGTRVSTQTSSPGVLLQASAFIFASLSSINSKELCRQRIVIWRHRYKFSCCNSSLSEPRDF